MRLPISSAYSGVDDDFASVVETMIQQGLDFDTSGKLMDKHKRPVNCPSLSVHKVNQEIWDMIKLDTRSADNKLQRIQKIMLKELVPVVDVINNIMLQIKATGADMFSAETIFAELSDSLSLTTTAAQDLDERT